MKCTHERCVDVKALGLGAFSEVVEIDLREVNPSTAVALCRTLSGRGWRRKRAFEAKTDEMRSATAWLAKIMHSATVSCSSMWAYRDDACNLRTSWR
jgi:hypothetical protein